jgi:hypothetical protein
VTLTAAWSFVRSLLRSKLLPEGSYLSQSLFLGDARLISSRGGHFDALRVLPSTHLASVTTPPVLLIIMSTKEDDVQNALERFEQKEFRQTALATTQERSTLGHHRLPRSQITVRNARLTKQQKEGLSSLYLRPTASLPTSKSSPNLSNRPATRESKRFL